MVPAPSWLGTVSGERVGSPGFEPFRTFQSVGFTPDTATRTTTSPGPASGLGRSTRRNTSGPPVSLYTTARIGSNLPPWPQFGGRHGAELSSAAMRRAARAALSRPPLVAALAAVVAVGLSACGGVREVDRDITAARVDGGAGFTPLTITVDKRNRVEIHVANSTDAVHGFSIEGYGVQEEVKPGEPLEVDFTATNAGTYKIYCQLHEAHRTATLIVR